MTEMLAVSKPAITAERSRKFISPLSSEFNLDPHMLNLLCSMGNSESKALLVAVMGLNPDTVYGRAEYYPGFLDVLRNKGLSSKELGARHSFRVCEQSLIPGGIVEAIPFPRVLQGENGYRLTEYGRDIAVSFAGHILDFSLKHPATLRSLLGPTGLFFNPGYPSTDVAPAYTRLKIFKALLVKNGPQRLSDLAAYLGETETERLGRHLTELGSEGVVNYKSANLTGHEAVIKYRFDLMSLQDKLPEEKELPKDRTLSQHVYNVARRLRLAGWITREQTANIIIARHPQYKSLSKAVLLQRIGKIFTHLATEGLIEKFGSTETRSEITLTPRQRKNLIIFLDLIKKFQEGDPDFINEGKRKALEIVNDPDSVRILLEKSSRKRNQSNPSADEVTIGGQGAGESSSQTGGAKVYIPDYKDVEFDWQQEAACFGLDTNIFFPETEDQAPVAKEVCATCPVREECLLFALNTGQKDGIWGGMDEIERERERNRRYRRRRKERVKARESATAQQ